MAYVRSNAAQTRWYVTYGLPSGTSKVRRSTISSCPVTKEPFLTRERAEAAKAYCEATFERREAAKVRKGAEELRDLWLASLKAQKTKPGTYRYYEEKITFIVAALSQKPISRWVPTDFEAVINERVGWAAKGTVKTYLQASRKFVKDMRARGYAVPDFTAGIKPQGEEPKESHAYTTDEIRALLVEARKHKYLEVPIALAVYAGLSLHDLRTLEWGQVDLDARLIRRKREKTGRGKPIYISDPLLDVLTRHRALGGPVCRDLPKTDARLYLNLTACMARAWGGKAPVHGWRSLRHTYGTEVAKQAKTIAEVAAALQHKPGSRQTLVYIHDDAAGTAEAVGAAGRAMS